tara:strand:- start:40054 stop:41811 length:1758 start_codon:yes stop_codon:yes gene_type:complete
MKFLKDWIYILSPDERKKTFLLLFMIVVMALVDMLGVASILPFMAVLINPEIVESNYFLNIMYQFSYNFGIVDKKDFLIFLGFLVFAVLIISLTIKAITTYALVRFVQMREYSISKRLLEGYLHQPYSWFLSRHSADIGKTILSEVGEIIGNGLKPLLDLIAKSMIVFAIVILLFLANPKLALAVGITIILSYGIIFYFLQNILFKLGKERLKNNEVRFKVVSEAFGAAKEIKISGLENTFVRLFSNSSHIIARNIATSEVIATLPRFFLEAVAFGGIILIILYIMAFTGSINSAIPIISLYVFAGYRLMPAIQQIYFSSTRMKFVGPTFNKVVNDLKKLNPNLPKDNKKNLLFNKKIELKNITYSYPNSSRLALKEINLTIPKKSLVGLIGQTGCGKTTTVDVILGLLEPKTGTLEVDEKIINSQNVRSWQSSIGYVPQQIYLSDDTVSANIAFGVNHKNINQDLVKRVSKIASLHGFVTNDLPEQYQTKIGERGVRLSGGQRQRIGIARALYHNPKILVLDEATSALDDETEKAVMNAINSLSNDITIILIAHRLNTLRNCDIIFKLHGGQIIEKGAFNKIIN